MTKGSTPRPHDADKFEKNFEKIFGKKREAKKSKKKEKPNG